MSIWQVSDQELLTVLPYSFGDEFWTLELKKNHSIYPQIKLTDFWDENSWIYFLSLYDLSVKDMSPIVLNYGV